MSDKAKIALIYTGVAVMCAGILALSWFAVQVRKKKDAGLAAKSDARAETAWQTPSDYVMVDISGSTMPTLTDQDGDTFTFDDLEGEVWLFVQFFAACPQCAKRNLSHLAELYEELSPDPNFRLVCVTVNPESDTPDKLKVYQDKLGLDDTRAWTFATGDKDELLPYMEEAMKYRAVVQRTDPQEIATEGEFAHDMAVALFDKDLQMRMKVNLYEHQFSDPTRYAAELKLLKQRAKIFLSEK